MRNLITLKKLLFACTFMFICISGFSQTIVNTQITTAAADLGDDAEERLSDGVMDLTSSDLELCTDTDGDQLVGIRFQGVNVPHGAIVSNCYIQFDVDAATSGAVTVDITGIDVDNAAQFTSTDYNISDRIDGDISYGTTSTTSWSIPDWPTIGDNGVNQRTVDISALVQEIIDRPGWASGNDMAFVFSPNSGSPNYREAEDGDSGSHQLSLHVEYIVSPTAEIDIYGNSNSIPNGTTTVSLGNDTDYGTIAIGTPTPHTFTIQNNGGTNLTVANPVITGHTTDFTVTANPTSPVGSGGSTTFTITFTPTVAGTRNATISITNNDSDENPYTFNVQGEGIIPAPEINVRGNGNSITNGSMSSSTNNDTDFGALDVSTGTNTNTFTIENTGVLDLNLTDPSPYITITGDTADFILTANPTTPITPSGSTTFDITFNPTSSGGKSATISIANNDSDENPYTFVVEGAGALINAGGSWSYLDDGTDHNPQLTNTAFNYAAWATGNAELGYGDADETTVVGFGPDPNNKYPTTYFRKSYTVSANDVANTTLVMRAIRDDGIAVYVNGVLVWTDNMPATWGYLTYATGSEVSGIAESTWITKKIANPFFGLPTGTYEIAVEIHQQRANSSDISFNFEMYTNNDYVFTPPTEPDTDGDLVADYLDADDDNDGVPDVVEGCQSGQFEDLNSDPFGTGAEESILSDFPFSKTLGNGNQIDYSITGTFNDITSYNAGEQGWSIRVSGPSTTGTMTFDFVTDVDDLFFKLVDFDENETWTVDVYDDTNTLIDLSATPNVYHVGNNINYDPATNTFSDANGGGGTNYDGDSVGDDPNHSAYFFFPGVSVSRIVFTIEQPDGSTIRVAGMQYCIIDTDGDGIDDTIDQDSDNDGIPDLVEAGGYDTVGNGIVNVLTDADGDGLADIYDNDSANYNTYETSTINFGDFDGDNVDNRIDLDSDNDGILDIIESGQTDSDGDGQVDGFTDSNNDGYHDSYDGAGSILITGADGDANGIPDSYPNENTDGTGYPSFIDIDSDDDGITDNTEAQATGSYIAYSTTDTDGDGIPNVFDNSGAFGGNGLIPIDTDYDCIPDYLDTNSDEDPEDDRIEGHDTNGDGIVNGSDSPNADTGLFTGTDTDNDGLDDGFDNNDAIFLATNSSLQATSHPITDGLHDRDWRASNSPIDFDGSNDFIDFGDNHDFTGSFSIEAWVLQENTPVSEATIVSKRDAKSGNERGYHLIVNSSNFINLTWYNGSGTALINITSSHAITNNKWHHVAATFDGTNARIYVDGIEVASGTPSGAPVNGLEKFMIGGMYDSDTACSGATNHFDGFIDEIRLWSVGLSATQLREMMNQEIQDNGGIVEGSVLGNAISGSLSWANLTGYYPMNTGRIEDLSNSSTHGFPKNITTTQTQTAPLPYTTKANGSWNDVTGTTPWTYGDTVWDAPNSVGIDGSTTIDWNIVQTNHDVTIDTFTGLGREREVLGLIVASNDLQVNGDTSLGTGNGLTVSKYLKLDGTLDLEGESQLIQSDGSVLDVTSSGTLERDQQGNSNLYLYNYWCSPVGVSNATTNNNSYTLPDIITNVGFLTSGLDGSTAPANADYWIWKYANLTGDEYSLWQHVRSTGSLDTGEGFTMKGPGTATPDQNYIFQGKPNNGDFTLTLGAGNEYLVGNPYPSAMDADEFITDNISATDGGKAGNVTNVINGALYFWDHFANNSHKLAAYEGGYAIYTLMGGSVAISNDTRINASGQVGTMTPQRYIPVGQGFFVSAIADASLVGEPNDPGITSPVVGGSIQFKNSQRIFMKEGASQSLFVKNGSKSKSSSSNNTNANADTRQKIRLMYDSPDGYHRQLLVGVDEKASNGFDLGYDALLAEDNKEDMYWEFNSAKLVIQAVNNFDIDQVLPLGIKSDKEGFATIKIDTLENILNDLNIYVHDKETDTYHDLREADFKVYLDSAGEYANRFEITFNASQAALDVDDFEKANIEVYFSNENESFIIHNPDLKYIESISVYNLLGQSIYEFNSKSSEDYIEHKTKYINTGIYIVKMKTDNDILSKKILVK